MYSLGIPERQFRRTTQVLGPEASYPIEFNSLKQNDGFYLFTFPNIDEYDFRDIVMLLKNNGVTTIGADDTLTERNIMKLTDLLKEQGSPDENSLLDILKDTLKRMEDKNYRGGGLESNELSDHYLEDIRDIIEDYEEDLGGDAIAMGADDAADMGMMSEQENKGLNRMDRDMTPEEEYLKDNPSPGTSTPMGTSGNTTKVKLKMSDIEDEVTIVEKSGKVLEDVIISWGNESHTVTFEEEGQIDDHGNEGMDLEFMAESDDGQWQFILDVYADASYPNTDPVEWNWEELIIQSHPDLDGDDDEDLRLEPEDNEYEDGTPFYGDDDDLGLEPETLQEIFKRRAGIIKNR